MIKNEIRDQNKIIPGSSKNCKQDKAWYTKEGKVLNAFKGK